MTPGSRRRARVLILGLDGVPHSFLKARIEDGDLPQIGTLARRLCLREVRPILPAVSAAAWATYMTGEDPGTHGIFGFVERRVPSGEPFIPTWDDIRGRTLWEKLNDRGIHSLLVNLPLTFPPREILGTVISGFPCPSLERACFPRKLSRWLARKGYVLDVDPRLGHARDRRPLLEALAWTVEKRFGAFEVLLRRTRWSVAHLHVMETDRIHHFLWDAYEDRGSDLHTGFMQFYTRLDGLIGSLLGRLARDVKVVLLSDHGFCRVRREVCLNAALQEAGWLRTRDGPHRLIHTLARETRAYSLVPGRLYLNLVGREPAGSVEAGEYDRTCKELEDLLAGLRDPATGERIIERVVRPKEIYRDAPRDRAPDLIAVPAPGYDLRAHFPPEDVFRVGAVTGMHLAEDAFVMDTGPDAETDGPSTPDWCDTVARIHRQVMAHLE